MLPRRLKLKIMADKRFALGSEPVIRVGLVDDKGRWLALEGVSIRLSVDGGRHG